MPASSPLLTSPRASLQGLAWAAHPTPGRADCPARAAGAWAQERQRAGRVNWAPPLGPRSSSPLRCWGLTPTLFQGPQTSLTIQAPVPFASSAFQSLKSFHFPPAFSPVPQTIQTPYFPESNTLPSHEIIQPRPQQSPQMVAVPYPEVSPGCLRVPKDFLQVSPTRPSLLLPFRVPKIHIGVFP